MYENPYYRKVRGSHTLLISCGHCKTELAIYQKVGRGGLLHMYEERIIKSSVDLAQRPGALFCPNCKEQVATRLTLKRKDKEAYRMIRSAFNTKEINL